MSWSAASCWTHSAWIRNCMTSFLSESYSLLHCFFSASSVGFFWPLGTGVLRFAATHFLKSGGSGTAAPPPCALPLAAVLSHLSNSSCVMVESPTLATAPAGTSLPQPAKATTPRVAAARARNDFLSAWVIERARRVAKGNWVAAQRATPAACATASGAPRFRGHLENRL